MAVTLKSRAYEHLIKKVTQGQLPPGTQLKFRNLARTLGMSMIPVREAVQQLASEGVVDYRPHTGAFVRQLDPSEIEELMRFRADS